MTIRDVIKDWPKLEVTAGSGYPEPPCPVPPPSSIIKEAGVGNIQKGEVAGNDSIPIRIVRPDGNEVLYLVLRKNVIPSVQFEMVHTALKSSEGKSIDEAGKVRVSYQP